MSKWVSIVPKEDGFYFYRPYPGMQPAVVARTVDGGFLFPYEHNEMRDGDCSTALDRGDLAAARESIGIANEYARRVIKAGGR